MKMFKACLLSVPLLLSGYAYAEEEPEAPEMPAVEAAVMEETAPPVAEATAEAEEVTEETTEEMKEVVTEEIEPKT